MEAAGAVVTAESYAGLVPMFCSDWLARLAKAAEPIVEATPLLRTVACAVFAFVAERVVAPESAATKSLLQN